MSLDVFTASFTSPYISAIPFTTGSGFGVRYSNPGTLAAGYGRGIAVSPAQADVVMAHVNSPYVSAWPWVSGTGFGAKYSAPATIPNGSGNTHGDRGGVDAAFSPDGTVVGVTVTSDTNGFVYISTYPWTPGSGFGSKYGDPGTVPVNPGSSLLNLWGYAGLSWSPDGSTIAYGTNVSVIYPGTPQPEVFAYPWSGGFGAKYTDYTTPSLFLTGAADVAFSPNGASLICATGPLQGSAPGTSPGIVAWPWGPGYGSSYADPSPTPSNVAVTVAFAPDGVTVVAVANASVDHIAAYPWGPGYGAKYTEPGVASDTPRDAAWDTAGDTVIMGLGSSPYVAAYPWVNGSGFGSKYADPGTLPATFTEASAIAGAGVIPPAPKCTEIVYNPQVFGVIAASNACMAAIPGSGLNSGNASGTPTNPAAGGGTGGSGSGSTLGVGVAGGGLGSLLDLPVVASSGGSGSAAGIGVNA